MEGNLYPLGMTGLGRFLFPEQVEGSLIIVDGKPAGSVLIGQNFTSPSYFWGRPSATAVTPYNASASMGSNLSVGNPVQLVAVKQRLEFLHKADTDNKAPVPVELVTASASGLDPHISPEAARYQIKRVAKTRRMNLQEVSELISENTEPRLFGVLGEPRVNVLKLNLALDQKKTK